MRLQRVHFVRLITALIACALLGAAAMTASPATASVPGSVTMKAHAEVTDDITWSIQPSSAEGPNGRDAIVHTLTPGQSITDYIGVSNLGAEPITVQAYAMDAQLTSDGAFSLPPAGQAPTGLGAWVGMTGNGEYTIQPGTRLDIPFQLTIPTDASPGDHAAGIVASVVTEAGGDESSPQMAVDRRVGVRLYVDVPGERLPAVEVSKFTVSHDAGLTLSAPATVQYTLKNTGNIRVGGTATIRFAGPFGIPFGDPIQVELPELLPGSVVTLNAEAPQIPVTGWVNADVEITPTAEHGAVAGTHQAQGGTVSVPWLAVAAVLLIGGIVFLLVRRSRNLRRRLAEAETALAALPDHREPVTAP